MTIAQLLKAGVSPQACSLAALLKEEGELSKDEISVIMNRSIDQINRYFKDLYEHGWTSADVQETTANLPQTQEHTLDTTNDLKDSGESAEPTEPTEEETSAIRDLETEYNLPSEDTQTMIRICKAVARKCHRLIDFTTTLTAIRVTLDAAHRGEIRRSVASYLAGVVRNMLSFSRLDRFIMRKERTGQNHFHIGTRELSKEEWGWEA